MNKDNKNKLNKIGDMHLYSLLRSLVNDIEDSDIEDSGDRGLVAQSMLINDCLEITKYYKQSKANSKKSKK